MTKLQALQAYLTMVEESMKSQMKETNDVNHAVTCKAIIRVINGAKKFY